MVGARRNAKRSSDHQANDAGAKQKSPKTEIPASDTLPQTENFTSDPPAPDNAGDAAPHPASGAPPQTENATPTFPVAIKGENVASTPASGTPAQAGNLIPSLLEHAENAATGLETSVCDNPPDPENSGAKAENGTPRNLDSVALGEGPAMLVPDGSDDDGGEDGGIFGKTANTKWPQKVHSLSG